MGQGGESGKGNETESSAGWDREEKEKDRKWRERDQVAERAKERGESEKQIIIPCRCSYLQN